MPVLRGAGELSGATEGWYPSAIGCAGHRAGSRELPKPGCGTSHGLEASLSLLWLCTLLYKARALLLGLGKERRAVPVGPGEQRAPLGKIPPPLRCQELAAAPQPGEWQGWTGEDGVAGRAASILPVPLGIATSSLCLLPAITEQLERPAHACLQHRQLGSRHWRRALAQAASPRGWGLTGYPSPQGDAPSGAALRHSGHPRVLRGVMLQPSSPAASAQRSGAVPFTHPLIFTKPVEQNVFAASSQPIATKTLAAAQPPLAGAAGRCLSRGRAVAHI